MKDKRVSYMGKLTCTYVHVRDALETRGKWVNELIAYLGPVYTAYTAGMFCAPRNIKVNVRYLEFNVCITKER